MLKIAVKVLSIPEVLRRHQPALHEFRPGVPFQKAIKAATYPIIRLAILKFADAIVLAPERHEIRHRGVVAAFHVRSQELAALGEAEAVDSGRGGKDGMGCEIRTDFLNLEGEVPEVGGGAIGRCVVINADVVCECSRVGFVQELADGAKAVGIVADGL